MRAPTPQRGVALITALLVMALASIAAAAVLVSAQTAIHRTGTLLDSEKSWAYATGVESWVITILKRDLSQSSGPPVDGFTDAWAKPRALPVEQGGINGQVEDLQGRFNLNNFAVTSAQLDVFLQFQRLFDYIPDLSRYRSEAPSITAAIIDWIDTDSTVTSKIPGGTGAEDDSYTGLTPPYRSANQPFKSPSELLAVKGVTPEIYRLLAPYICTLPTDGVVPTKTNINTVLEPVLLSLSATMDAGKVSAWVATRKTTPASDTTAMYQAGGLLPADTQGKVSVITHYFLLHAETYIGTGRVGLYSVVMRPSSGDPFVITRSIDTE